MAGAKFTFSSFWILTLLIKGCTCIPLPGVHFPDDPRPLAELEKSRVVYPDSLLPNYEPQQEIRLDKPVNGLQPSNGILPDKLIPEETHPPRSNNTNEVPLAKILDSIYGNSDWRSELQLLIGKATTVSTRKPTILNQNNKPYQNIINPSGFYGNKISANGKVNTLHSQTAVNRTQPHRYPAVFPTRGQNIVAHPGGETVDTHYLATVSQTSEHDRPPGASGVAQAAFTTDRPLTTFPTSSYNPPPSRTVQLLNTARTKGNFPDESWSNEMRENNNYEIGTFDPNKVNNLNTLFNPGKSVDFLTQTGSNPDNANGRLSFNADVVNDRYMQSAFRDSPPGSSATETQSNSGGHTAYHFSAYNSIQSRMFNPDTLNMRLFDSHAAMTGNMPPGVNPPNQSGSGETGDHSESSMTSRAHIYGMPRTSNETITMAGYISDKSNISQLRVEATHQPMAAAPVFNFIPGNLYPGQRPPKLNNNNQEAHAGYQAPPFLHGQNTHANNQGFDPNALNAAQNLFNPNAVSWIHRRSSPIPSEPLADPPSQNVSLPDTSTVSPASTSAPSISSTAANAITPATTAARTAHESSSSMGFDPNAINTSQGSNFVPGQLMPVYSKYGFSSSVNGPRISNTDASIYNPNKAAPVSMSFNILEIMGMSTKNQTGQTGYSAFNPTAFNNVIANIFNRNSQSNDTYQGSLGNNFMNGGFDPNAVNVGFGDVLGKGGGNGSASGGFGLSFGQMKTNATNSSKASFGFGSVGFDPNAANVGFGSMNYGSGGFGNGAGASSFLTGFDANKINQAIMQNPYGDKKNGSGSAGISQYMSGQLGLSFISSFNPDSVNKVSFDPSKFNTLHLHFDPVEMLVKNPGVDNATLQSARFDPEKINSMYSHLALSPAAMLLTNPGINAKQLAALKYDPSQIGDPANATGIASSNSTQSSNANAGISRGFDPFELMQKQMQVTAQFKPGTAGKDHVNFDPLSMIGQNLPVGVTSSHTGHQSPATSSQSTSSLITTPTAKLVTTDKSLPTATMTTTPTATTVSHVTHVTTTATGSTTTAPSTTRTSKGSG